MYVVVIGLGQVGRHVIRALELERHDVVAIDTDAEAVAHIEEHHDVMTMMGYGANQEVLARAEVSRADLVWRSPTTTRSTSSRRWPPDSSAPSSPSPGSRGGSGPRRTTA